MISSSLPISGILGIIFLIFFGIFLFVVYSINIENLQKKAEPQKVDIIPPADSVGWLYVLERDGYIKVGKTAYWKTDHQTGLPYQIGSLKNRMIDYINPSETPHEYNVDLIYYHLFDDYGNREKKLINFMQNSLYSKEYNEFNNYNNPKIKKWVKMVTTRIGGDSEWFEIQHDYNSIKKEIIENFFEIHRLRQECILDIINTEHEELSKEGRVYLHTKPSTEFIKT